MFLRIFKTNWNLKSSTMQLQWVLRLSPKTGIILTSWVQALTNCYVVLPRWDWPLYSCTLFDTEYLNLDFKRLVLHVIVSVNKCLLCTFWFGRERGCWGMLRCRGEMGVGFGITSADPPPPPPSAPLIRTQFTLSPPWSWGQWWGMGWRCLGTCGYAAHHAS